MRQWFGLDSMEPPEAARAFLSRFVREWPFTAEAQRLALSINFEVHDLSRSLGGGFWFPETRTVQVRGHEAEALIHELAHAYWETARTKPRAIDRLIDALQRLAEEPDPKYRHLQNLAHQYVEGDPDQKDDSSPTGYWQGMRNADGSWIDWEVFAGLASGSMANLDEMPPYLRLLYEGLFTPTAVP
ncbi:MAG: hypothetical protein IT307_19640 [Chloroflexi bacterium]|nr:hypothetical protein [Chloroflexota bacterium]